MLLLGSMNTVMEKVPFFSLNQHFRSSMVGGTRALPTTAPPRTTKKMPGRAGDSEDHTKHRSQAPLLGSCSLDLWVPEMMY